MRNKRASALLLVMLGAACGRSTAADGENPTAGATARDAPASRSSDTGGDRPATGPSAQASALTTAFGLSAGLPIPEGLVPGGDCPAAGAGAAQEVAGQAAAPVPLKAGLTLAYTWMRTPQEEYECLIHVESVDDDGINTTMSCNLPERGGPFRRRVCRADLRSARMLHTLYGAVTVIDASGKEQPETIVGATAFSLSSADFATLEKTGVWTYRYVELASSDRLAKDGVGELRVEGRDTMRVIVNDRPVEIPVIKTRGSATWWIRGKPLETSDTAVILDNRQFPLLIDQHSTADGAESRIFFAKITFPHESGASPLEGGLLDNKRVDVYGIYFDFNSDRIRAESEPVLKEIGDVLKRHPDWHLSIDGHTDNIGGDTAYNLDLSRRRSDAVRSALVSRFGIAPDRLTTGGHGAGAPKDTNDTPEGRARNRRVELVRR